MPSGDKVKYSDLGRIVARGRRSTATGNLTTTETGVLRLDNVPVFDSRAYAILSANLNVDASVANDIGECRYRVAQATGTGTTATTSSTQIGRWRSTIDDATNSNVLPWVAFYYPSADGYLSVLLSAFRASGSGNIVVFANNVEPIDLVVLDLGPDPGDTGVVL
jgi:hypothetical protein